MFDELSKFHRILEARESAREELIRLSRELRINSTKAISAVHASEIEKASKLLEQAENKLQRIIEFRKYPEFYFQITHDAMQEYVESFVFFHLVKREQNFNLESLDVEIPSILTGLADSIGEMRRYTLDLLRKEEFERAEDFIKLMEELYYHLSTFYFPEKLVPGLRNKVDGARWTIERTKSDFIAAKVAASIKGSGGVS
ncbi:MAG TPA: translin [Archaeoglobaceae archaeon]|nr:translin [Archaeoglobaceae archaeon]